MRVALIGFSRSGKTTVGKELARFLNTTWQDSDVYLCERFAAPDITALFRSLGKEAFRSYEGLLFEEACSREGVFSCGGGIVECRGLESLFKKTYTIYLRCKKETILLRLQGRSFAFLDDVESFDRFFQERCRLYEKYATHAIDCDTKTIEEIVSEVFSHVE